MALSDRERANVTCDCWAVEGNQDFCTCGCDYCAEYCLLPEPDFDDEGEYDCLGCGTCGDCVAHSIAYAEEMAATDPPTDPPTPREEHDTREG